ncbi:hypothetical protein PG994_005981 [Apiospora phragmitis]|uniref:WW domain-containing protein n=1 Tax=Apiospora phragmitis TaxID=2905665 RepID=A0ABR1VGJ1_9PEZI
MSSTRYNLRPIASRVAATRAAQELGISASEARRRVGRPASRRQQPRPIRIRLAGAWAPENRAQLLREERLRHEQSSYHLIIQNRPLENPDKPRLQVTRHSVPSVHREAPGQQPVCSIRQYAHQRLHSIHDNKKGAFVYHHMRDAGRDINTTWLGRWCVSLYDFNLRSTIWENPGMFNFIRMLKDTTDEPLILNGRVGDRHVYNFDCRTHQYTWKAPGFV